MAVSCGLHFTLAVSAIGKVLISGCNEHGQLGGDQHASLMTSWTPLAGDFDAHIVVASTGGAHSALLDSHGQLWMCGRVVDGLLGIGVWGEDMPDNVLTPMRVPRELFRGVGAKLVACGKMHTLVLTEFGRVWAFGSGGRGQLGTGDWEDRFAPTEVEGLRGDTFTFVAAGFHHSVAVSARGGIFTWGCDWDGRLGLGRSDCEQCLPQEVAARHFRGDRVVQAAAGEDHTAAVTAGGRLFTWGGGFYGQLGHGSHDDIKVPTLVGRHDDDDDDDVHWPWLPNCTSDALLGNTPVLMAACGSEHTLAVTEEGKLYACGGGNEGQLGHDQSEGFGWFFEKVDHLADARIVAASAGFHHSAAVTEDGSLFTWGGAPLDYGLGDFFTWGEADAPLDYGLGDSTRVRPERWYPKLVERAGIGGALIGQCRAVQTERALAFAMATHMRLGGQEDCVLSGLSPDMMQKVMEACRVWEEEGLVRLQGAGARH